MRILGIDPGLNITGYGLIDYDSGQVVIGEAGVIRGERGAMSTRVTRIHSDLADLIASEKPEVVALEELYSHYRQPRTAILMAHARGVICLAAGQHGVPVESYSATQVKRLMTGNGRASKSQMQAAVCRELQLDTIPEPHDVADALAIALTHAFLQREVSISK